MTHAAGVLPDHAIRGLVARGAVVVTGCDDVHVQPASLDLGLGPVAYRVRSSFLPGPGRRVADDLPEMTLHEIRFSEGGVLEPGAVYLVPLAEGLALPPGIRARSNPKSSTGRLDVFVRLIVDGASVFDEVPDGYSGPLWLEIAPRTFPVMVRPGSRLAQLRFVAGDGAVLDSDAHKDLGQADGPSCGAGLTLTADLSWPDGVVGWRARRHTGVVDMDAVGTLDAADFWEPVRAGRLGVVLDPGEFYILASREPVRVPVTLAAEMAAFDPGVGEFRAHYAGFFDPGFGCGDGDGSSRAVLEVRTRDVPFLMRHGQAICRLVYQKMSSSPSGLYGGALGSHYNGQGLRLSKAFRPARA